MKHNSALLMSLATGLTAASFWICPAVHADEPAAPRTPKEKYEAGRLAYQKKEYETARVYFQEVLKAAPDFDLAKMYLAQIRQIDRERESRPLSEKLGTVARVKGVSLHEVSLEDALELARRELVRAGGGEDRAQFEIVSNLPDSARQRVIDFHVRDLTLAEYLDAVSFAGNVKVAWHPQGLAVTSADGAVVNAPESTAARQMKRHAAELILPAVKFDNVRPEVALEWLRDKAAEMSGGKFAPEIIARQPLDDSPAVTLDLRSVSLQDALNSVCVVSDLRVSWHSWGAGVARQVDVASAVPVQP